MFVVLGFTGWLWRRLTRDESYTLEELLPTRKEFRFLVLLLASMYLFTGFLLRLEAFPSIVGHLTIWIMYILLAILLQLALKHSRVSNPVKLEKQPPQWLWIAGILTFAVFSAITESLLLPLDWLISLVGWFGTALLGVGSILYAIRQMRS